jgi:UDP-N-acetylglucosamine 2-epimerase (non-hydrolysing)
MKVALAVGARPNYLKAKPILPALEAQGFEVVLVHTGQHYDGPLFQDLFQQIELRDPDVYLGPPERDRRPTVPEMISAFSTWCAAERPAAAIVVGDVDSTLACAVGARAAGVPVIHVEAGLRSFDRAMPEEVNRIVVDGIADLLLVSDPAGVTNLEREGRGADAIRLVGNVMIDTLYALDAQSRQAPLPASAQVDGPFALLTLHRPSNVDSEPALRSWLEALAPVCARIPVVFPMHPRTARSLRKHGLLASFEGLEGMRLCEPVGYLQCVRLQREARFVMTDSGGIQEESSVLSTPCLTLRETTERPITLTQGCAVLTSAADLGGWVQRVLAGELDKQVQIDLWDGKAGERVAREVHAFLSAGR